MQKVIDGINHWIQVIPEEFNHMSQNEISTRLLPHKWSKKEILGHLCDSAINNINRFITIQYEEQPYVIPSYNQDKWVVIQNYQSRPMEEILSLFIVLNQQIINIILKMPSEKLSYLCDIGNNQQKRLEWLLQDYLDHMEHHINNQIFAKNNA
ncbi:DinB family protein [Peribacillus alkalitolerans]|uniref:DinB family protein n=1 Tax=Peribacillus alkalitolerans TaxID=1550385 RepID=UPI0013D334D5|nr:DinB family protein [Peribacillus alkalitolerans]